MLAVSLLLGSLWALISATLSALAFIVRTALEDKTLQREFDGYADYARQVRYRLVPGIWQARCNGSWGRRNAMNTERIIQKCGGTTDES